MLPSQTGRPKSSRSHMYRRPKSKRLPFIIAGLVVLVGVTLMIKYLAGSGKSAAAGTTTTPPTDQSAAAVSPSVTPSQTNAPKASAPPSRTDRVALANKPPDKINLFDSSTSGSKSNQAALLNENRPASTTEADAQTPKMTESKKAPAAPPTPPATQQRTPTTTAPASAGQSNPRVAQKIQVGFDLLAQNNPIEARPMLTSALETPGISPADAERIRNELSKLNQRLVFGREVVQGDPFTGTYNIVPGDLIVRLPRKLDLHVESKFLMRINNISDERRIQAGQRIKYVRGPFHAVVVKPEFRLDLYMGDGDQRIYVRSFTVGLGEQNATPEGQFALKPGSKMVNPAWRNPRTGEAFGADDPKNPLGEYWIGLVGTSDNIRGLEGYGIHGTIDPDSVGKLKSMGCVRMLADDIALLYELLVDNGSTVEIRGPDWP